MSVEEVREAMDAFAWIKCSILDMPKGEDPVIDDHIAAVNRLVEAGIAAVREFRWNSREQAKKQAEYITQLLTGELW